MATFEYHRASSVEEAVDLHARLGEGAHYLAGGQSLLVLVNLGLAQPSALIDIDRVPDLSYLRRADDGGLRVSALTRHADVEQWQDAGGFAVLPRVAGGIAYPAIRARGTFAGVLAHADPTGEWCVLVQLLGADVHVVGPDGPRTIAANSLFVGPLLTNLQPGELIVEVRFPPPPPHIDLKKLETLHPDFPTLIAAAAFRRDRERLRDVRIAVGGAGGPARRVPEAERVLEGQIADRSGWTEAGRVAAGAFEPASDADGVRYCRQVVAELVARALEEADLSPAEHRPR